MQVGEYFYIVTLEQHLVSGSSAKLTSSGVIVVKEETPRSEIVSNVIRTEFAEAKKVLVEQGYAVRDDEPNTIFFYLEPQ